MSTPRGARGERDGMENILSRNWGWVALRGSVALIFGVLTIWNPAVTLAFLVFLFGAYALVDGMLAIIAALTNRRGEPHWVALLIGGLAGVALGAATFVVPGITATVLLFFIGAWALLIGGAQIATAIRLRRVVPGEWLLMLAGVLSVVFGCLLVAFPGAGALAVVLWIGAYAVVFGVVLIALALRLRSWGRGHGAGVMPHPA